MRERDPELGFAIPVSHVAERFTMWQRGCQECVWDVYWNDMKEYNEQLAVREGKPPPLDPFEVR